MPEQFCRNELIWGKESQEILGKKHVFVFGLGGVGGFALESLARAGVKNFTIADFDTVSESNINRQIIALHSTVGMKKCELFKKRLLDINPEISVRCVDNFYSSRLDETIFETKPDFVVDAIDTLRSKIELLIYCKNNNIPVITSMGAGNRTDPTKLYITDISKIEKTKCTFCKNVLYRLNKAGITSGITAVVSSELPGCKEKICNEEKIETVDGECFEFKKFSPGSTPFVPAVAGYYTGYYAVEYLINKSPMCN